MPIALITHTDCRLHDAGPDHPEQPARLDAIQDRLISSGMNFVVNQYDAPLVERAHLERVHDPEYVDRIFSLAPRAGIVHLDSDTYMMSHTLTAALRAAGAGVYAVDLILDGEADAAFCAVRPPGHHAERRCAMGFCYFNNIAVAAAYALDVRGLERIAIVDFDVHHGNGTENIFQGEPRALFCSSFQHPFYPFTGHETETEHIVNIPLPAGSSGQRLMEEVEAHWLPALDAFEPQMLFISAGFDAHVEDDMSHLRLKDSDYDWLTNRLKAVADRHAGGRILSILEGGYALDALGRSVAVHLKALLGNQ